MNGETEHHFRGAGNMVPPSPVARPAGIGWWWVFYEWRWRCGRVIEDWDDDSGGLIWSDGGAWYRVARINAGLLNGSHWFPAGSPDWANMAELCQAAASIAGHIQKPMTAREIADSLNSGDYNAELILQHLLRLVSDR